MVLTYIGKVIELLLIFALTSCIGKLYKVFEYIKERDNHSVETYAGYVSFGILAEVIILIWLIVKLITG